jgi:hypothetical protein
MPPHLTSAQWQADLDHLVRSLEREHRNLFHTVSHEHFDNAVRSLRTLLPALDERQIPVELARLVALIGDGHTRFPITEAPGFRHYPIRFYRYADGLFVQSISPEYAAAAGARLLAIAATPALDAYDAMRPLISRDNEMGVRSTAPMLLSTPEVLQACGVLSDPEHASFVMQYPSGERLTHILRPIETPPTNLIDAHAGAPAPTPLWLRQSPEHNWFEHLGDAGALYVRFDQVRDGQDKSLATFFDHIFALIERENVGRLILDIRLNVGGNMSLNHPLIHHLIRCDAINQWGRFFVIIGRHTFSAAMNLAVDLERHTRALFVGEPTGGRPNHYGENAEIILPHSGLRCTASSLWWQYSDPSDDRPWIAPDIPAPLWSGDYAANRDPALDAVLNYVHTPDARPPLTRRG